MDPLNWCCKNDVIVNFNLTKLYNIGLGPLKLKIGILRHAARGRTQDYFVLNDLSVPPARMQFEGKTGSVADTSMASRQQGGEAKSLSRKI